MTSENLTAMLTRDGTAEPVSRDEILQRERGQRSMSIIFPVLLTTSRIGNLARLILSCYMYVMTLQTYIHTIADPKMCAAYNIEKTECGGPLLIIHFIPMVGVGK